MRINNEPKAEQPAEAEEPKAYSQPRPTREEYEARINNEPKAEQPAEAEEPKAYSKPRPTREEYEAKINSEQKTEESSKPQGAAEEPTKVLGDTPLKPQVKPLYSHLGLENNASFDEVKKAYRKAALKSHPDRNPGNVENAQIAFQKAQNAYEILSSPEKRHAYDNGTINEKGQFENGTMFR